MWLFCETYKYNKNNQGGKELDGYTIGFIQGEAGRWIEALTVKTLPEAMQTVNYLNGGNGFPYDLRPPAPVPDPVNITAPPPFR